MYSLGFGQISQNDVARVGNKSASLAGMLRAGVAVPPGFSVTVEAFQDMLRLQGLEPFVRHQLDKIDPKDLETLDVVARSVQDQIRACHLPEEIEIEIQRAYAALGDDVPVAVRSSATAEDLPDASFAGQLDSYLWVVGADDVVARVRDCWASLYSKRALSYRIKAGVPNIGLSMGVAVQKMVNARVAGVAITLDPNTGDRSRIAIDASWGLGETVVSGLVTPDNFIVEKVMEQILERTISDKQIEHVADLDTGTVQQRLVPEARRKTPSLTDAQVLDVARLSKALEGLHQAAQDVEWAFDADLPEGQNLMALQTRPETVWSTRNMAAQSETPAVGMMGIVQTLTSSRGRRA